MVLSQTATYALRAVFHLAENRDQPARVEDLSAELDIPRNYLSKVLHVLAREGVLKSTRGPRGGFVLAREPARTSLADVVGPFDDVSETPLCLLGRPRCSDRDPCPAHGRWSSLSRELSRFFHETTVESAQPPIPSMADPPPTP